MRTHTTQRGFGRAQIRRRSCQARGRCGEPSQTDHGRQRRRDEGVGSGSPRRSPFWRQAPRRPARRRASRLVIGNGAYRDVAALANPPNDAKDVAAELGALGFKVTVGEDLDQATMERKIADFAKAAASADVSLFYYGGHGLQVAAPQLPHSGRCPTAQRGGHLQTHRAVRRRAQGAGAGPRRPPDLPRRVPHQSTEGRAGLGAYGGPGAGRQRGGLSHRLRDAARQCRLRRRRPQQPVRPVSAWPSRDESARTSPA